MALLIAIATYFVEWIPNNATTQEPPPRDPPNGAWPWQL
jgi:hypothetical protein